MNPQVIPNVLGFIFSVAMSAACAMDLFADVEGFHGWPIRGSLATVLWAVVAALCSLVVIVKWRQPSSPDEADQEAQSNA